MNPQPPQETRNSRIKRQVEVLNRMISEGHIVPMTLADSILGLSLTGETHG